MCLPTTFWAGCWSPSRFAPSPACYGSGLNRPHSARYGHCLRRKWWLFPSCAYGLYLVIEAVVHGGYYLFHAHTLRQQLGVLALVLLAFMAAAVAGSGTQERWQQKGASASSIAKRGGSVQLAAHRTARPASHLSCLRPDRLLLSAACRPQYAPASAHVRRVAAGTVHRVAGVTRGAASVEDVAEDIA